MLTALLAVTACSSDPAVERSPADRSTAGSSTSAAVPIPPVPPVPPGQQVKTVSPTQNPLGPASGAPPTRLLIPAIGVDTGLVRLAVDAAGELEVPGSYDVAGWYEGGPAPGETGPALLVGHVDSETGPAVFFDLGALAAGDQVEVVAENDVTLTFTVVDVRTYLKDDFPADLVYGPTPNPQLRLITCGGTFNPSSLHYESNVVVSATLT